MAFLVFLGHVSGVVLQDDNSFALTIIWLIGVGCLGAPFFGARTLGRRLTAHTCHLLAAIFGSISLLLTILFVIGEETPAVEDVTFALILPMAIAVQAFNAADALGRLEAMRAGYRFSVARQSAEWRGAVERTREQHLEACLIAEHVRRRELAEVIDFVGGLNTDDADLVQLALDRRAQAASLFDDPQLRVVPINGSNKTWEADMWAEIS